MTAYYNENNPKAAAMLRQLIKDGLIADGEVDERSIADVKATDLIDYDQCHFFAGIGGWSVALRLAGWPDDQPVWTGSCPCQPFSTAGKRKGKADERHLWPQWARLIRKCRPATIFGEQVEAAVAHGWWDEVADDLEGEGYAVGAAVLPACSVGAPQRRYRLWFVGCSKRNGLFTSEVKAGDEQAVQHSEKRPYRAFKSSRTSPSEYVPNELWSENIEPVICPDDRRPVKSGLRLLAHGFQHRVPILHAFGNAIVPACAAAFIQAYQGGVR